MAKSGWKNEKLWTIVDIYGHMIPVFHGDSPDILTLGQYGRDTRDIKLTSKFNYPFEAMDSTWHELGHAIEHITLAPEDRLAERQINTIASAQMYVLLKNPIILEFLLEQIKLIKEKQVA